MTPDCKLSTPEDPIIIEAGALKGRDVRRPWEQHESRFVKQDAGHLCHHDVWGFMKEWAVGSSGQRSLKKTTGWHGPTSIMITKIVVEEVRVSEVDMRA